MTYQNTLLYQEIMEQPQVLRRLIESESDQIASIAAAIRAFEPQFIMIAARGTSDNAARYAKYLFGAANQLPVALATPSLFTLYDSPPNMAKALVLGVSQSGASPDIIAVIKEGARQGALTVAITNDPASPLASTARHTISLHAGPEKSVAATKTYTASLMSIALLSTALAGKNQDALEQLYAAPDLAATVTGQAPSFIEAANRYRYMPSCILIGRGYNYATAFEVALKLKELTYVLADPYSPADFEHGPVALVDEGFPVLAIVPEGRVAQGTIRLLQKLRERQAELMVISAVKEALSLATTPLVLPSGVPEWISPLIAVMPGQILALGLTLAKGLDPDHPRGLSKVTLTH